MATVEDRVGHLQATLTGRRRGFRYGSHLGSPCCGRYVRKPSLALRVASGDHESVIEAAGRHAIQPGTPAA